MDIREYFELPIPNLNRDTGARSFHEYPVNLDDERSQEPLVDVEKVGLAGESYYARTDGLNAPYYTALESAPTRVWIRQGVAERLRKVNAMLEQLDLEVFIFDGYRPIACQQAIYDWFTEIAKTRLEDPTPEACRLFLQPYISNPSAYDPMNMQTWPSHITGGAVDLTLRRRKTGEHLYMGGVFDDPSDVSHTSYYETADLGESFASREARRNRRLLFWVMHAEGFASLPSEWWHYDWGNQMWSKNRHRAIPSEMGLLAFYGPAEARE